MKQFSLDEYLANPLKKVVTRDGRSVKIHCTNYIGAQNIIAQIEGNDYSASYHKDGIFINGFESNCDLFFAPEKHKGWINVYRNKKTGTMSFGQVLRTSREEAEKLAKSSDYYVATAKIEWEE